MAKHRFQHTRWFQATRHLLLAVLAVGLGIAPGWADQQTPKGSGQSARATQASGKRTARATTARSARASAQRKGSSDKSGGSLLAAGKRDPFKLPELSGKAVLNGEISESMPGGGGVLPPGERGLLISQLRLEGVVRQQTQNKMIAVVTNDTRRAYFLRENQSVYNGVVSKITPDAVYFKENVLDSSGRVTTREVVKRLGSAPGEGR